VALIGGAKESTVQRSCPGDLLQSSVLPGEVYQKGTAFSSTDWVELVGTLEKNGGVKRDPHTKITKGKYPTILSAMFV